MIYCVSDIHGEYRQYRELPERMGFCGRDTLYVLGDVVDWGSRPNVIPLMGNHEFMALHCLRLLLRRQAGGGVSGDRGGVLQRGIRNRSFYKKTFCQK